MDKRQLTRAVEYLRVLDLDAGAGIADIREVYWLQVCTWNPDNAAYDARIRAATERKLADVRQAYEWLKANGDAVLAQTAGAGPQSDNGEGALTRVSLVVRGVFYVALVGLLVFGIGAIAGSSPDAWLGPLGLLLVGR